ncbi:6,7-dimethyl-8-ribityllumazine synthase 1 [Variibacter gotjawalensis]|uniref:6,7-dimethyl-8-ribityllumazine synthase n=1 Tax=Variibacter gotjawalensis TaxID=1333996 RepID=A0A0S3PXB8_9BRAD|nr:6,7-dimethyl-8-ribityllumazine synthase [Variibacter gotjawalensis]NIK46401.1 6,7-dimethyl-8-ribityllumazine synthase [Variibacter gotjawalensis]RZS48311.1 6,7-dimethyl-8-ribityllumazine synthase [Variibacter gotjawalensis]BAT60571.1 6,7-dimethyl-8-ribityllumazine synthase 1 [Variibacter gotjawalensis]
MAEAKRSITKVEGAEGAHILVIEARYYEVIGEALWLGASRALSKAGATAERINVAGALEIPTAIVIARDAAEAAGRPYDGAVALGCVIRGETSHYDIVAGESARALMDIAIADGFPVGNGILTVDTEDQAMARAALDRGDKGGDAVRAALGLVALKRRLAAGA